MAEEGKACCCGAGKKTLGAILKVIIGIILLVIAGYLMITRGWWLDTWQLIKGCAGPFLILAAFIFFAIAKE